MDMHNTGMFTSNTCMWGTPQKFFDELNKEFNFDVDVCAVSENAKCKKFFSPEMDGLKQNWGGYTNVWCNPPYGREMPKWIEKAHRTWKEFGNTVVMLIPARTDTKAFHEFIYHQAEIRFVKGRLKFNDGKNPAPFPSMIVIFKGNK
ncbi:MAG: phage N-6-adenine-methyltransferase [Treponema sp.]|nr:phage N-6-adenine-methyltransferase [Treponema sp.]